MAIKLALITHNPEQYIKLLEEPSIVVQPPRQTVMGQTVDDITEEDLADTTGEWRFANNVDPAEAEEILAGLMANPGGTLGGNDLEGHWQ